MKIVFLGDIATDIAVDTTVRFDSNLIVANLEGAITEKDLLANRVVYNGPDAIKFLKETGVHAVSLANNHIYDVTDDLTKTKNALRNSGISFFGACLLYTSPSPRD